MHCQKYIIYTFIYIGLISATAKAQELRLQISGKDSSETRLIDSVGYQQLHPSFHSLQQEVDTLLATFRKIGYLNAERRPIKKRNDSLFTDRLILGKAYTQIKIFYPPGRFPKKELQKISSRYTPHYFIIPFRKVQEVLQFLNRQLADKGRPFNSLHLSALKTTPNHHLEAHLRIHDTKKRSLDSLVLKGYKKFPRGFLRHFLGLKKGQPFNKTKLDKKVAALKNLSFAQSVRPPEVLFTQNKSILYLYLKKQNSNHFEGFLGFSTDEDSKKLRLDGDLQLRLVNNLNFGEALYLKYKNNGSDQQHFKARLHLPFLFSGPVGVRLELEIFRQDSSFTTTQQTAAFQYYLNPKASLSAGYEHHASTVPHSQNLIAGQTNRNYTAKFFTIGGKYLVRNPESLLFPLHTQIDLTLGLGRRSFSSGGSPQQKIEFSGQHSFRIDQRNRIFVDNRTYALFSKTYVANELFRFGGIHSVRGFAENSLRASFYSTFQVEYRYLLSRKLYVHTLTDYAHFENARLEQRNNLYGIGFGLGMRTKAGLIKVDFANGKTDGQSFEFKNTKVHLSLEASF